MDHPEDITGGKGFWGGTNILPFVRGDTQIWQIFLWVTHILPNTNYPNNWNSTHILLIRRGGGGKNNKASTTQFSEWSLMKFTESAVRSKIQKNALLLAWKVW